MAKCIFQTIACLFFVLLFFHIAPAQERGSTAVTHSNSDSLQIDSLIHQLYNDLSVEPGGNLRYNSLYRYFVPSGQMIANVGEKPIFFTIDQFVKSAKEIFSKQAITVWKEQELCAKTNRFGKVAQRFSTYQIKVVANGQESIRRGMNAIQLIKQNGTWLITSLAWDRESNTQIIPEPYRCYQTKRRLYEYNYYTTGLCRLQSKRYASHTSFAGR